MKRLNKIFFFKFAFIGAALLIVASFWYVLNWERRPAFIESEMAIFKDNFDGAGLGFTFGQGSMKGRDLARILGWGYGWGLDETQTRAQFLWFSWTEPDGRIWFNISSDIKLTGGDLTGGKWSNQGYASFHGTRILTPDYWRDFCAEVESSDKRATEKLVCGEEHILNYMLMELKEQISSISKMEVVEYLFSK